MNIYLVIKTGVYDHGCMGAYRNADKAIALAEKLARIELEHNDLHHDFRVFKMPMGQEMVSYEGSTMPRIHENYGLLSGSACIDPLWEEVCSFSAYKLKNEVPK